MTQQASQLALSACGWSIRAERKAARADDSEYLRAARFFVAGTGCGPASPGRASRFVRDILADFAKVAAGVLRH